MRLPLKRNSGPPLLPPLSRQKPRQPSTSFSPLSPFPLSPSPILLLPPLVSLPSLNPFFKQTLTHPEFTTTTNPFYQPCPSTKPPKTSIASKVPHQPSQAPQSPQPQPQHSAPVSAALTPLLIPILQPATKLMRHSMSTNTSMLVSLLNQVHHQQPSRATLLESASKQIIKQSRPSRN